MRAQVPMRRVVMKTSVRGSKSFSWTPGVAGSSTMGDDSAEDPPKKALRDVGLEVATTPGLAIRAIGDDDVEKAFEEGMAATKPATRMRIDNFMLEVVCECSVTSKGNAVLRFFRRM
jgi:hypothetical protein